MNYARLLPYAFKRFSLLSALRTLLPTIGHYLTRTPLPPSERSALFTMNILPPMMTVWHHYARKSLGNAVDIVIFDCSGTLKQEDFPGARIQKFLNPRHAVKCDEFLLHIARKRAISWVCDDDVFLMSGTALDRIKRELAVPNTACVSFEPRPWWHFEIDGKQYEPSGTYCIAFNEEIVQKEHVSFAPADGNTHPSHILKPVKRYDSFDKSNELLLKKGYRCAIVPKTERREYIAGFTGMSGAVMLLNYFTTPDQVMDYYLSPPKKQWQGTVLFGTLSAMLAIRAIQECYEKLKGKPYSLPALPSRAQLEKLRSDHEQYLPEKSYFHEVDDTSERLKANL